MEKTITNHQYLQLMNFFTIPFNENLEIKRIQALCTKYNITFAIELPRSKYKEALKWLHSGEWNK